MSYCVNCGVQLDSTRAVCPLCDTPVYNPRQPIDTESPTPYPKELGREEEVLNREFTQLMTVVLGTIAVVCGVLNYFILDMNRWSLYIIGVMALIWVFLIPVFFRGKVNTFTCIALDGVSVALYLGMIGLLHPGQGWYLEIALPIAVMATLLVEVFYVFTVRRRTSVIGKVALIMGIIAVVTVVVEVLIGFHFNRHIVLTWSAVVLLCCMAVDVILLTLSLHKGLRSELRKRMHF